MKGKLEKASFRALWKCDWVHERDETHPINSYFCLKFWKGRYNISSCMTYPAWKHEHFISKSASPRCMILVFNEITAKWKLLGKQMDVDWIGNLHCIYQQEWYVMVRISMANNTVVGEQRDVGERRIFFCFKCQVWWCICLYLINS